MISSIFDSFLDALEYWFQLWWIAFSLFIPTHPDASYIAFLFLGWIISYYVANMVRFDFWNELFVIEVRLSFTDVMWWWCIVVFLRFNAGFFFFFLCDCSFWWGYTSALPKQRRPLKMVRTTSFASVCLPCRAGVLPWKML